MLSRRGRLTCYQSTRGIDRRLSGARGCHPLDGLEWGLGWHDYLRGFLRLPDWLDWGHLGCHSRNRELNTIHPVLDVLE